MQLVPLIHENMFCLFFCPGRSSVVSDLDNIFSKRRYFNKGHPAGQVVKMCCVSRVTRSKAKFVERVWPEGREKMRIQKVDIKGCYIEGGFAEQQLLNFWLGISIILPLCMQLLDPRPAVTINTTPCHSTHNAIARSR